MEKEKKYSLEELSLLFSSKGYITLDRFNLWFKLEFGLSDSELKRWWNLYDNLYNILVFGRTNELEELKSIELVEKVNLVMDKFTKSWQKNLLDVGRNIIQDKSDLIKIFYTEFGTEDIQNLEINRSCPSDLMFLSTLLNRVQNVKICRKISESYTADKNKNYYEGDIFSAQDSFFDENKHSIFIAIDSGFRKLAYVKGLGYLNSEGDLNYFDKTSYNHYVVSKHVGVKFIGNIITHSHFLRD